MTKKIKKIILFLIVLFVSFAGNAVYGAEVKIITSTKIFEIGEVVRVDVVLDTEGKSINAVEGEIYFPKDLIKLSGIRDGASVVGLWIKNPQEIVSYEGNKIIFSGLIPNGFSGTNGLIATLLFTPLESGKGEIGIKKMTALENDGEGQNLQVKEGLLKFSSVASDGKTNKENAEVSQDVLPPNDFTVSLLKSPDMYDGRFFIIFNTYDNDSGIDRYELLESKNYYEIEDLYIDTSLKWRKVTSPALLVDQDLKSYIYVKAIDRSGNARISFTDPSKMDLSTEKGFLMGSILTIIFMLVATLWVGFWQFKKRSERDV